MAKSKRNNRKQKRSNRRKTGKRRVRGGWFWSSPAIDAKAQQTIDAWKSSEGNVNAEDPHQVYRFSSDFQRNMGRAPTKDEYTTAFGTTPTKIGSDEGESGIVSDLRF